MICTQCAVVSNSLEFGGYTLPRLWDDCVSVSTASNDTKFPFLPNCPSVPQKIDWDNLIRSLSSRFVMFNLVHSVCFFVRCFSFHSVISVDRFVLWPRHSFDLLAFFRTNRHHSPRILFENICSVSPDVERCSYFLPQHANSRPLVGCSSSSVAQSK